MPAGPHRITRRALLRMGAGAMVARRARSQPRTFSAARIAVGAVPQSLDPHTWVTPDDIWIGSLLADAPLRWTPSGVLTPGIVSASLLPGDDRTWELMVRPDAMFPGGRLIRSTDIAETILRAGRLAADHPGAWRLEHVAEISTPDPARVWIRLTRPDASIPATLAAPCMGILPAGETSITLRGASGPYIVRSASGSMLSMIRHQSYWQIGRPGIALLQANAVENTTERITQVSTGVFDIVPNVSLLDVATLKESPDVKLVGGDTNILCMLQLNLARDVLADVRLRRILARAIDRSGVIRTAINGEGTAASALFQETSWVQSDVDVPPSLPPAEARAQLETLGVQTDLRLNLIAENADSELANVAVVLQNQLAYCGVAVDLELLDDPEWTRRVADRDYDMVLQTSPPWRDPHELVRPLLHSTGQRNGSGYRSPFVDYLIDQGIRVDDQAARQLRYERIAVHVVNDVPIIPLYRPRAWDAYSVDLENVVAYPPYTSAGVLGARRG